MEGKSIKIGWIGTGVMGKHQAAHLIKNGYTDFYVFNRTASKADELVQMGAKYMESPRALAKEVDVLFMMLGFPEDVKNIIFDAETGILDHMKKGSYIIDHTTSSPGLAVEIAKAFKERGVFSIDAPVSGGDVGAKSGKLVTMIGGEQEAVDYCGPIMNCYSAECKLMGGPGAGQHTKMANQIMIGTTMVALCEALIYAHKAGLDLSQMIVLLQKGAANSFSLEKYGPRMLRRDFEPGFYVEHFVKDLTIALEEGRKMNLSMPGTALAQQLYIAMMAQGGARMGTQGLLKSLEQMNNTEVKKYDI